MLCQLFFWHKQLAATSSPTISEHKLRLLLISLHVLSLMTESFNGSGSGKMPWTICWVKSLKGLSKLRDVVLLPLSKLSAFKWEEQPSWQNTACLWVALWSGLPMEKLTTGNLWSYSYCCFYIRAKLEFHLSLVVHREPDILSYLHFCFFPNDNSFFLPAQCCLMLFLKKTLKKHGYQMVHLLVQWFHIWIPKTNNRHTCSKRDAEFCQSSVVTKIKLDFSNKMDKKLKECSLFQKNIQPQIEAIAYCEYCTFYSQYLGPEITTMILVF